MFSIFLPRKIRCALRQKGAHAFAVIVAASGQPLIIALQVKLCVQGVGFRGIDRLLDQPQPKGGLRGKMQRQLLRRAGELVVIHHLPDHSPGVRLFGAQFVAKQRQPHGPGAARPPPLIASILTARSVRVM